MSCFPVLSQRILVDGTMVHNVFKSSLVLQSFLSLGFVDRFIKNGSGRPCLLG